MWDILLHFGVLLGFIVGDFVGYIAVMLLVGLVGLVGTCVSVGVCGGVCRLLFRFDVSWLLLGVVIWILGVVSCAAVILCSFSLG